MVQSKGKKSSVNFKYYALENWLLSLISNRLSPTARHFPAKASLEPLDRSGMLCKLWRKERQKGESRASTILHIILLLSGKLQNGRKMVHPTFGAMRQLPKDLFHLSSVCPLDHGFPRLPPQLPQPSLQRPTRARYTRVRRFSFFAFTSSPQGRKKLCINDL